MFRFGSKPNNNTQEHNTEALQPVFMFGAARFHLQQEKNETTREELLQDTKAQEEECATKPHLINKKIKKRRNKVIS